MTCTTSAACWKPVPWMCCSPMRRVAAVSPGFCAWPRCARPTISHYRHTASALPMVLTFCAWPVLPYWARSICGPGLWQSLDAWHGEDTASGAESEVIEEVRQRSRELEATRQRRRDRLFAILLLVIAQEPLP